MNMINRKSLLAAILCISLTGPAFAVIKTTTPHNQRMGESVTVSFADLDISKAAGLAVLHQRLKMAASRVCHVDEGRLPLSERIRRQECFDSSMQRATDQLDLFNAVGVVSN